MSQLSAFFRDRIQVNALLIVLCFVSVLMLPSQSAASYASYLLTIAMLVTVSRWNDVFRTRIVWLAVALLIYLCISSFWSEPFGWRTAFSSFSRALLVFCFVVALAECQLRGVVQSWLGKALALTGGIAALVAIVGFIVDPPSNQRLLGLGQLDNPVVAALILGVVLIILLDFVLRERSIPWRAAGVACMVIIMTAIYLADARNPLISIMIGVGVLLFAHLVQDRQKFLVGLVALGVLLGVVITTLMINDATREWLLPRGDSFRLDIWSAVLGDIWPDHWMVGRGILTPDAIDVGYRVFLHPHNMYLAVLFQGGLVALLLFGALIGTSLRALYLDYERPDAKLALAIFGVALPSYLLDGHELIDKVGETWFLFWLPFAISLGLSWNKPVWDIDQ